MASENETLFPFLIERSAILEDIRSFLDAVLSFCVNQEDEWGLEPDTTGIKKALPLRALLQSLCQIHGLYGYPANTDISNTGLIEINKRAVSDMLSEIEQKNKKKEKRTLLDYSGEAVNDEFWKCGEFSPESSLEDTETVLREPAHIFLQMVGEVLGDDKKASEVGRKVLETLPDRNYLKPVMWAEHKNKPECFGVSLGVRSFVRPLYLGIKLSQLRKVENGNDDVKLKDVNAFQSMDRNAKPSKYKKANFKDEIKPPCDSCQIFFEKEPNFNNPLGNCAEYDVIRTANSIDQLRKIKETQAWSDFELVCKNHLIALSKLTEDLKEPDPKNPTPNHTLVMKTYYKETRAAKVLKYEWNSSKKSELKSTKRKHGKTNNSKTMEDNKKTKRMKSMP